MEKELINLILWGFILLCYIVFAVGLWMFLNGYALFYGRDWKKKFPEKLKMLKYYIQMAGAMLLLLTALLVI